MIAGRKICFSRELLNSFLLSWLGRYGKEKNSAVYLEKAHSTLWNINVRKDITEVQARNWHPLLSSKSLSPIVNWLVDVDTLFCYSFLSRGSSFIFVQLTDILIAIGTSSWLIFLQDRCHVLHKKYLSNAAAYVTSMSMLLPCICFLPLSFTKYRIILDIMIQWFSVDNTQLLSFEVYYYHPKLHVLVLFWSTVWGLHVMPPLFTHHIHQ